MLFQFDPTAGGWCFVVTTCEYPERDPEPKVGRNAVHYRAMIKVHATCVEWGGGAVLLRGPPGSGKSDLGLRLIDGGGRLVADDQVQLDVIGGSLVAGAPPAIAGKIEIRGLGLIDLPEESVRSTANVVLIADLVGGEVERLPEPEHCTLAGIDLPVLRLCAFEASAAAKVRVALEDCLRRAQSPGSRGGGPQ